MMSCELIPTKINGSDSSTLRGNDLQTSFQDRVNNISKEGDGDYTHINEINVVDPYSQVDESSLDNEKYAILEESFSKSNSSRTKSFDVVETGEDHSVSSRIIKCISPVEAPQPKQARVAVVSPLFTRNTITSNTMLKGKSCDGSLNSFSPEGGLARTSSPYKLNNSPYKMNSSWMNQSDSSLSSINGNLDNEMEDKYIRVGYNTSPSTTPKGRDTKAGWYDQHEKHKNLAKVMYPAVLLCGDSIVAGLTRYSNVWNKYFKTRLALNCGIAGDQTQHVLWRMEDMTLPSTVNYIVIHCGTNNIDRDTPDDIASGIISIGLVLQEQNAKLQIIVTALIPRDYQESNRRQKIRTTNNHLKQLCRTLDNFYFMKQDSDWIHSNGTINEKLYYSDHLHLIESGNEKLAKAITSTIDRLERNEALDSSDEDILDSNFERKTGIRRHDTPWDLERIQNPFDSGRKRSLSSCSREVGNSPERKKYNRTEHNTSKSENTEHRYPVKNIYLHSDPSAVSAQPTLEHETLLAKRNARFCIENANETNEFHGSFAITKELKHEKLEGTVKSIDITLTDADRLAARRAKFGGSGDANSVGSGYTITAPVSSVGSSLKKLSDSSKAQVLAKSSTLKRKLVRGSAADIG